MDEFETLKIRTKIITEKSKTTLIIPFCYSTSYLEVEEALAADWIIDNKKIERKNILEHVSNLIASNQDEITKGTIGRSFDLKREAREKYHLPVNTSQNFYLMNENGEEVTNFKVTKVSLYVFETQIGFLLYDIKHTSHDLETIILTNYHLKHLHHLYNANLYNQKEYFVYFKKKAKPMNELSMDFRTLSEISGNMLNELRVHTYFTNSKGNPETALLYNFMLLDKMFLREPQWEHKLKLALFQLRKGYKNSYLPSPFEFDIANNPQTIQLFKNSYWGVSLEGLANLAYLTENDVTNDFFSSNYIGNLEISYFYIYILALHQRYAFLALNVEASEISKGEDETIIDENTSEAKVLKLRKEINFLILRGFFKHVSSVTHQQALYEVIAKNLSIEELKQDIHSEMEALASLAELQAAKREKEKEKRELELREQLRDERRAREAEEQKRLEQEREERRAWELLEQNRLEQEKEERRDREREEDDQREKNTDRFLLISTIFVVISTITGSWSILVDFFVKSKRPPLPIPAPYVLLILSILMIALGIWGYKFINDKWKSNNSR
ncbi:hypothetical protein ABES03_16530 [Neobacillus rhizosphaerae]|uniref:hypothetical protein n=1 Tax=Neobacillus rhizosphaerae TaxID=2880965 RepID=UPI003D2B7107